MFSDRISLRSLEGHILVREWPNWLDHNDETEFMKWRPTLTEKEWDRYTVAEAHNLLTNDGITSILKNIAQGLQAQLQVVSQILSIGNGAITGVTRADTAVAGDGFGTNARRAPNSLTITGTQADIGTNYLSGDANGTITNLGFYGWNFGGSSNATTTTGTGTLKSHALISYVKGASAVTFDYVWILSN